MCSLANETRQDTEHNFKTTSTSSKSKKPMPLKQYTHYVICEYYKKEDGSPHEELIDFVVQTFNSGGRRRKNNVTGKAIDSTLRHLEREGRIRREVRKNKSGKLEIHWFPIELTNTSHLFIHPKGGEDHTDNTAVECGVSLYHSHARCYYIYDSDRAGFCDSYEYGPEIPYSMGEEAFMAMVSLVLNKAAKVAEDRGVRSCPHCGDHYNEEDQCDCQEDDEPQAAP